MTYSYEFTQKAEEDLAPYPKEQKLRIIRLGHGLQDQAHLFMDLKSH